MRARRLSAALVALGLALAVAAPAQVRAQAPATAPPPSRATAPAAAAPATPAQMESQTEGPPLHLSADKMSGSHGPEGDVVVLNGNVRIVRGATVITSQDGTYDRTAGMLYLQQRVRIVDSTTVITCDNASYSEKDDVVQLSGNVRAQDKSITLSAPSATYDRVAGRADLYGGVKADYGNKQHMLSDRAAYFRDSMIVHARGNVRGIDDQNKVTMTAQEVDFNHSTNEAEARGAPALEEVGEDGHKTRITSRLLRLNSESHVAEALDSVRVVRDSLQATGDYGLFDDQSERGWLLGNPRAWDNETNLVGDTLEFRTHEQVIERLLVRGKARLDYTGKGADSKGETTSLTGRLLDVYFTKQDIDSLIATGEARNEYVAAPQQGKTPERNLAEGDTIRIYMKDRKIDEAVIVGKAHGRYRPGVALADTASATKEAITYEAATIRYVLPKSRIELDRDAHLTYNDLDLRARRVQFDSEKQTLVAEGSPELVDRGDKVDGQLMTYDLESRVGNIYKAETTYEKGLYHGERIRKVSDNELQVLGGSYSTCALDNPHYHFGSRYMKIYLKDKMVARPVVFYLKNVPLLALPFWIFPIKPGRHSGFLLPQFEAGFNNAAGRFFRNAGYYWAPNDYFDFTGSGDYYQAQPSYVLRGEGYYKLQYLVDGSFRTSYARDKGLNTSNWDLDASHEQELSPRTRLSARASFVSSRDYNSSNLYGRSIAQRLNRFLTSNVAISHSADWASFNLVADRRQDLDADNAIHDPDDFGPLQGPPPGTLASLPNLTQNLPALSVSFPTRSIGSLPGLRNRSLAKGLQSLYLSLNSRFLAFNERRAYVANYSYFTNDSGGVDSVTNIDQRITTRRGFGTSASLTDSRRLFGWINMQPGVSGDVVVFDFDELGHKVVPTGTWSANVASSASLYGTYLRKLGPVTGIRHVVTPRVSFTYSPEFANLFYADAQGIKRSRYNNFGTIAVSGFRRERLDFGLDQRLQLKVGQGEKARKLENFASLSVGGAYNFLYREAGARHPISPLGASLFLQPPGVVNGSANATIDPYEGRPLRALSYNTGVSLVSRGRKARATPDLPTDHAGSVYSTDEVVNLQDAWNLGLSYSYSGGYPGGPISLPASNWASNQNANLVLRMRVTPAWSFNYSTSYDVTRRLSGIQYFSVSRDLHCWVGTFSRTFAPGGEAEYYFRLSVKDQRELYVERGTRTGSLGGIQ